MCGGAVRFAALGEGPAAQAASAGSPAARRLLAEARYYREHVLPWIHRRLRGRSSGDDRTGKYLDWIPVPASLESAICE
jgi:hypothetical protein